MKPSTVKTAKFMRLMKQLGTCKAKTRGLLDNLWDSAHSLLSITMPIDDVELRAEWDGEEGVFVRELLERGWLDRVDDKTVAIHDFWEHAPTYVRGAWKRKFGTEPWNDLKDNHKVNLEVNLKDNLKGDHKADLPVSVSVSVSVSNDNTIPLLSPLPGAEEECEPQAEQLCLESELLPSEPAPDSLEYCLTHIVDAWNVYTPLSGTKGIRPCRDLTQKRKLAINARWSGSRAFRESWREAISVVQADKWCSGANSTGWRADLDWFLRPDQVEKILERAEPGIHDGYFRQTDEEF